MACPYCQGDATQEVERTTALGYHLFRCLRQVWLTPHDGSKVYSLSHILTRANEQSSGKILGQIQTILRNIGNREVFFARAVLLVEDQSQLELITGVARTLGFNLDASSVSVISVDGESGFPPFLALMRALAIPFVALKDKVWSNDRMHPPEQFFAFDKEIEQYLDEHDLRDLRAGVAEEVGVRKLDQEGKRRLMAALAPRLEKDQIPAFFNELLQRVTEVATGAPCTYEQT